MNTEKYFNEFVKYAEENKLTLESVAIADGEKVLHEHHFVYDYPRNIYSHTKSYTAITVIPKIYLTKPSFTRTP